MREEYTRETYPSFGKKYSGEKAIISLTSWKARIDTVSKTLYSLIKQCPGFHIVLVLSEEEFPKMMDELPANLKLFVKNNLIEVLWVYKNYKSFKKVLFTMDKYRDVPVISADDDCIYTCNYAQELYDKWISLNKQPVSIRWNKWIGKMWQPSGAANLYFGLSLHISKILVKLSDKVIDKSLDDEVIGAFLKSIHFNFSYISETSGNNAKRPFIFHDDFDPIHTEYRTQKQWSKYFLK